MLLTSIKKYLIVNVNIHVFVAFPLLYFSLDFKKKNIFCKGLMEECKWNKIDKNSILGKKIIHYNLCKLHFTIWIYIFCKSEDV